MQKFESPESSGSNSTVTSAPVRKDKWVRVIAIFLVAALVAALVLA